MRLYALFTKKNAHRFTELFSFGCQCICACAPVKLLHWTQKALQCLADADQVMGEIDPKVFDEKDLDQ